MYIITKVKQKFQNVIHQYEESIIITITNPYENSRWEVLSQMVKSIAQKLETYMTMSYS